MPLYCCSLYLEFSPLNACSLMLLRCFQNVTLSPPPPLPYFALYHLSPLNKLYILDIDFAYFLSLKKISFMRDLLLFFTTVTAMSRIVLGTWKKLRIYVERAHKHSPRHERHTRSNCNKILLHPPEREKYAPLTSPFWKPEITVILCLFPSLITRTSQGSHHYHNNWGDAQKAWE